MQTASKNNKLSKKVIISCYLSGCLEIYDFVLFGFLAPVFHKNYLSFLSGADALFVTYILFAVGFVFRPVGSILFGYIGDRLGRKKALVLSVSLMGISSISMCLLPTYSSIGILSCYLIAVIRMIQGISVGGEYSGALVYAIEHSSAKRAGLVGGIIVSGCLLGVMLARLVSTLLQNPSLPEYSWRFAFLLGFLLSLVGLFIRNKLIESPEFIELDLMHRNSKKIPLLEGFKKYPVEILAVILLVGTNGVNMYFISVFLVDYLKNSKGIDLGYTTLLITLVPSILAPVVGYYSDFWNRRKLLTIGIGLIGVYSFFALPLALNSTDITVITCVILGFATLFSLQSGTMNTLSVEVFAPDCRYSASSFSYAVGMALIGGLSPMISSLITKSESCESYLTLYICAATFLGFIAGVIIILKEKSSQEIIGQRYS